MSTYSDNLKIELIGDGEQTGTWGSTTNNNFRYAIEQAIVGYGSVVFTNDANQSLSISDSNAEQTARMFFLEITSSVTLTQQRDLTVPSIEKTYTVYNNTTGGQAIRIKTAAALGGTVVVPNGKKMILYVDAVNVIEQVNYITNLDVNQINLSTALPLASGGTGSGTASGARTNLGLGTIATQAANNVAITGGSITGITDLAIADGGTGSSTANGALNNLLPTQTSNAGKYLKTDGTNTSWDALDISTADITGTLPIANGGTNATTAGGARTNLGATTLGSNMFTLINPSAVTFPRFNADNTVSALDAASFRTAIGAGSGGGSVISVDVSGGTTGLTTSGGPITVSGTITLAGTLAVANGGTGATTAANARTNLGLGTISTQNSNAVTITGGSISGITDLAIADGGTGASTAADARTNLAVPSTTGSGASGTWGISISGNATTATTATNVTNAYGVGQSWSDVTASRALSTNYTNSTGKPIQVIVTLTGGAPGQFSYSVIINGNAVTSSAQDFGLTLIFMVPNGQTYQVTTSESIASWWELR